MARKPSKASIKAAADRAEARAKGEDVDAAPVEPSVLNPPVHPGGRPTEYKPELCQVAADMCAIGATDEEVAYEIGISVRTLYRWKSSYHEFCQALKLGKEACDERVERSLFNRAVGYTFDSVKILQNAGVPLVVPYKEHVPPDVGAAKLWLINRQPEKWADIQRKEVSGPGGAPIEFAETSEIDQARRVAFALGKVLSRSRAKTPSDATE